MAKKKRQERKVVFVTGPLLDAKRGDMPENVMRAHNAGLKLLKAGLIPVVHHSRVFWGNKINRTVSGIFLGWTPESVVIGTEVEEWCEMNMEILRRCDALLRLPGVDVISDREMAEAKYHKIPIFLSVDEAIEALVEQP